MSVAQLCGPLSLSLHGVRAQASLGHTYGVLGYATYREDYCYTVLLQYRNTPTMSDNASYLPERRLDYQHTSRYIGLTQAHATSVGTT